MSHRNMRPQGPGIRKTFGGTVNRERGVSAVIVAIALMLLVGVAALALDGGNLYQERRSVQNAADQAVVAAAYTECVGGTFAEAITAGQAAAAMNGYDNADADVVVTISQLGPNQYTATVASEIDATFARAMGTSEMGTTGQAVASCIRGVGQVTALHAHATNCPGAELVISLNASEVIGGATSNGDINIPGNENIIVGGTSYGYGQIFTNTGSPASKYDPLPVEGPTDNEWPVEYDIAMYQPGGYFDTELPANLYTSISGDRTFKNEPLEGIYYVNGNITVQEGITVGDRGVTLVATGTIATKADNLKLRNFDDPKNNGLLFFSNYGTGGCSTTTALNITGDHPNLTGIMYAPKGKALVTGDGANSIAVWANFVVITGDDFIINAPSLWGFGDPEITLDE